MLNTIVTGEETGETPLVIAHGLFGSARNWGAIARKLSETRQVIAVDMRNHGASPHDPVHDYEALAADLAEVIDGLGGKADLMGHSMGGKAAMVLALTEPARLNRLIVVDMAPVEYGHSQIEYVEAMKAVDLSKVSRRGDADAQLREHVSDAMLRGFFLQSLEIGGGGARWKLNLGALEDQMPKIMSFPAIGGGYEGPALFVTGEKSDYVDEDGLDRIRDLFPNAEHRVVKGAGHWAHAEAPEAFLEVVGGWL